MHAALVNDSSPAFLFQISGGIFQDFRDCQIPGQHPSQASKNDSYGVIEHCVWNLLSGSQNMGNPYSLKNIPYLSHTTICRKVLYFQRLQKCVCHALAISFSCPSIIF